MTALSYVGHARLAPRAADVKQGISRFSYPNVPAIVGRIDLPAPGNDIFPIPAHRLEGARIFIAGHTGLVGSALRRRLRREQCEILTVDRQQLDLRRQLETENWIGANRPDIILLAAATVGGIAANRSRPAEFMEDNLAIALNVIQASRRCGVKKLVFLGSSCIYPRDAAQPMSEDALLTGALEPTNEAYAIAKIAGLKLAQSIRRQDGRDFISIMPTNLYGPGDTFDPEKGHVIPALIHRMAEAAASAAPEFVVWGGGQARREFLHVDDCADGVVHALKHYSGDAPLNLGSGEEVSIATLATLIAREVGYRGRIVFDAGGPEGAPRKLLDSSRIRALGWRPRISLRDGLSDTIRWWQAQQRLRPVEATGAFQGTIYKGSPTVSGFLENASNDGRNRFFPGRKLHSMRLVQSAAVE